MNKSIIFQICYASAMFLAIAFTVAGMFTQGWRSFSGIPSNVDIPKGLFEMHCPKLNPRCEWWEDMPTWNKVIFFAISFAILIQFYALVWSVLAFVFSSRRRILFSFLIALSVIISFLLAIVITNFATNDIVSEEAFGTKISVTVGYSYYLTCGAFVVSLSTIGFAIAAFHFAGKTHEQQGEIAYNW